MKNWQKPVIAVVLSVLLLLYAGCGGDKEGGWSPFLTSNGTGVRGLDTPDQILSNPYVKDALDDASDEGVNITPEKGVNPPVISGTYGLAGEVIAPGHTGWHTLSGGMWRWSNQTSDNHIDTHYEVNGQEGYGAEGEIIRGTGREFTIYTILNISDWACTEQGIMLFDGRQDNDGNVSGVYIVTPAQDPVCHVTTVGRLELTLTGAAKAAVKGGDGALLMSLIKDAIELPTKQNSTHK